jgi:hypothetical protein
VPRQNVFVSYDYDNDRHYKNMLLAWDKHTEFDFSFCDVSVDVSVNSTDAAAIGRVRSARIGSCTRLLFIVGQHTHRSTWVDWEIRKAVELHKPLVGVKIDRNFSTPSPLLGAGAKWAMSFTFESIKAAIA